MSMPFTSYGVDEITIDARYVSVLLKGIGGRVGQCDGKHAFFDGGDGVLRRALSGMGYVEAGNQGANDGDVF